MKNSQAVQSASTWEGRYFFNFPFPSQNFLRLLKTSYSLGTFPDLRKRARQLENDIDAKLLNLNKLGVNINDPLSRLNLRYGAEA